MKNPRCSSDVRLLHVNRPTQLKQCVEVAQPRLGCKCTAVHVILHLVCRIVLSLFHWSCSTVEAASLLLLPNRMSCELALGLQQPYSSPAALSQPGSLIYADTCNEEDGPQGPHASSAPGSDHMVSRSHLTHLGSTI